MILNLVTGRPHVATVKVTTTAGATVTCVLSPYSLSATANSSGVATFVVPKIGTWVCTATSGSLSKSANASVTTVGSTVNVTITLAYYLFKAGEGAIVQWAGHKEYQTGYGWLGTADITTDYIFVRGDTGDSDVTAVVNMTGVVDVTNFSKIAADIKLASYNSYYNGYYWLQCAESFSSAGSAFGASTVSTIKDIGSADRKTLTLDISSFTGNRAFGLYSRKRGTGLYVYNLYLIS